MNNQTIRELRAIAKERGLRGYFKLRKAELISLLGTSMRPLRRPEPEKSLSRVTLLPKPEDMDSFELQEMAKTRSGVKSKLNEEAMGSAEKKCARCKCVASLDSFRSNKRTGELNKTCSSCLQKRKCQHGRLRSQCGESPCEGSQICQHGRRKDQCKESPCKGSQICQHGRCKSYCKESPCRGSQICSHGRRKFTCSLCKSVIK